MTFQHRFSAGYFYSFKNKRIIEIRSTLEGNYFLMLEFDKNVKQYQERPFQVFTKIKGKKVSYTPDCLITFKNADTKSIITEIRYRRELFNEKRENMLNKIRTYTSYVIEHNMHFRVITEKDIENTYLNNLKLLYRFTTEPNINGRFEEYRDQIISIIKKEGSVSVENILKTFGNSVYEKGFVLPVVWFLITSGVLKTDLNVPLTNNSIVGLNNDKN